jgi:uncharacterized protein involved in propanediol utilization
VCAGCEAFGVYATATGCMLGLLLECMAKLSAEA